MESNLTYIGTFGLHDPLRENALACVELVKFGRELSSFEDFENDPSSNINQDVNLRMLSGDHIETARQVAYKAGLITQEEMYDEGVVITAQQFRQEIGEIQEIWDPTNQDFRIEFLKGRQLFDQVKKRCKVIARCTSKDKFIFVCGIKQKGGMCGMTGHSISDSEALKKADVGFCMGSGCDVAKDNSDLVILDDDLESIHSSVKWGRAIFDNVRKFMQFQLTINFVICFITILGGCTVGVPPLNVIQMLWINLMMDILGAISIGTEPYKKGDKSMTTKRISRRDNIIKIEMMRNIICQSLYQLIVMIVIMYFGGLLFFEQPFNLINTPLRDSNGAPTSRLVLNTMCFHTFFLMNWFNTFNSRVIGENDINIFRNICNNTYFWLVMILELVIQLGMIRAGSSALGSALLGTAPLNSIQNATCWSFGIFSLVVHVIGKKIPLKVFSFASSIDLENDSKNSVIDRYMNKYDDVYKKVGNQINEEEN